MPADPGEGEREWVLWVELWLRAAREPELRPVAGRMYESYREWVAGVIRRGVESGEFREVDPDEVADLAMALFDGLGVRALIRDPAMSLDARPPDRWRSARRRARSRPGSARRRIDPADLLGAAFGVS